MKTGLFSFVFALVFGFSLSSLATTHYVDVNGTNPSPPYLDWSTAATNIQDAVDASVAGDLVLVTNGVYATGGRPWNGSSSGTNRVNLTNGIALQSVNGPAFTTIVGSQILPHPNSIRCVAMGGGAFLSGFTLTNGEPGGTNFAIGGGVANFSTQNCTVSNCVVIGNEEGAYEVHMVHCLITGNIAFDGGGADDCTLVDCTVSNNTATLNGGGVYNFGGIFPCSLSNCVVIGNYAQYGGGVYGCTVVNSLLANNGANTNFGGASDFGTLINCTLVANSSYPNSGAALSSTLINSIIYYNTNGDCSPGCILTNCCTPVVFSTNVDCITNPPGFVDPVNGNYRLQIGSPCIDAGYNDYAPGPVDLDGNPRIVGGAVDMGAYENQNINENPYPVHYVSLTSLNPTAPFTNWSTAATSIQDAVDASANGDFVLVSNGVYAAGGTTVNGFALANRVVVNKAITIESVNGPAYTTIQGFTPPTTNGPTAARGVWMGDSAALIGFTVANGATLATGDPTNEMSGGGIWCLTTDEVVSNCVVVSNACPFYGGGAYQGTLLGCILTNNLSETSGGGAYGSDLSNCIVAGNLAFRSGGGAYAGTLYDCTVSGNIARSPKSSLPLVSAAGGVGSATVVNCIINGNSASVGGGAYFDTILNSTVCNNTAFGTNTAMNGGGGVYWSYATNCIAYFNTSITGNFNNYELPEGTLDHCCTFPMPSGGVGNFTNDPAVANLAGGDFHLQSTSPCINAGNNAAVATTTDFDGNPRIQGGTVDVGAYEYQTPTSILSYAWAQQYGIPTDGSADFADPDGDGMNNWQEWIAGTNPTNALSVLALLPPAFTNSVGVTVTWQSVTNQTYYLQRATDPGASPAFSSIGSNIVGQTGFTTFLDSTATNSNTYFYRVGIQQPYNPPSN